MDINGRPDHIEDYLVTLHLGQWFGWDQGSEPRNVYANLIILSGDDKPSETACTNGLAALQTAFDDAATKYSADKTSGNNKLKALGLTDDEITAITT